MENEILQQILDGQKEIKQEITDMKQEIKNLNIRQDKMQFDIQKIIKLQDRTNNQIAHLIAEIEVKNEQHDNDIHALDVRTECILREENEGEGYELQKGELENE